MFSLNAIRKNKTPVTVFLVNGVKLQGIVTWFDNFSMLLRRDGHTQLVYKHAISNGHAVDSRAVIRTEGGGGRASYGKNSSVAQQLPLYFLYQTEQSPTVTVIIHPHLKGRDENNGGYRERAQLEEASGLAAAINLDGATCGIGECDKGASVNLSQRRNC